jgi:Zn-dependent protease
MQWTVMGPSLKVYRLFGITVRLHWTILLLPFLAGYLMAWDMSQIHFGLALLGAIFVIILIHEYGHALVAQRSGAGSEDIVLGALGGAALCGEGRTAGEDVLISFAGPMINILLAGALLVPIALNDIPIDLNLFNPFKYSEGGFWVWLYKANLFLLGFNLLLPLYPLDGGRILTGLIAMRTGKRKAMLITTRIAILLALVLLVLSIAWGWLIVAIICGFVVLDALRQLAAVRRGLVQEYPGRHAGAAWESEFSWRPPEPEKVRRPGPISRWLQRRRENKRRREEAKREKLRQDVDMILDKVKREGMASLSPKERSTLEDASRQMRGE